MVCQAFCSKYGLRGFLHGIHLSKQDRPGNFCMDIRDGTLRALSDAHIWSAAEKRQRLSAGAYGPARNLHSFDSKQMVDFL